MNLIESIQQTLNENRLLHADTQLIVGVSGGADSVALLHLLARLSYSFTVAHVNHQLRAEESDQDEHFVRQLAQQLNQPFVSTRVDVVQLAKTQGVSIEMAARLARHSFFRSFGNNASILLAHHADDQIETFLLKLARGAGLDGLSGMPYYQRLNDLVLIRPLLHVRHKQIIEWLTQNKLSWREDRSNAENDFLRNRMRNQILPQLVDQLNPAIGENVLRTMSIIQAENDWAAKEVEKVYSTCLAKNNALNAAYLLEHHVALQRRVIRQWIFANSSVVPDFYLVDRLLKLLKTATGTCYFSLSDDESIRIQYGELQIKESDAPLSPSWVLQQETGIGWRKDHGKGAGVLPAEASFRADKIANQSIEVRSVQPGDRIKPLGMQGSCKLQDIFTDQKIPKEQRALVPVVICQGEVIWVPGYRIARGWELSRSQEPSIHLRINHAKNTMNKGFQH